MADKKHPLEVYADERGIPLTDEERRKLWETPRQGYVSRAAVASFDGDVVAAGDVPWYYSDNVREDLKEEAERLKGGREPVFEQEAIAEAMKADLPVIVRRSPQERLNEMTQVLVKEFQRTGVIPDSIIADIKGLYWEMGSPDAFDMSAEDLRAIAAFYLQRATRMGETSDPSYQHDIR